MSNVCEILAVGTEILLGDIINTDAAYIAGRLAALGFPSYRQTVVGDNDGRLADAIREAFTRADILILMAKGQTQQAIHRSRDYADSFGKYELEIERYFDHSLSCRVLEHITRKPAGIILD